MPKLITFLTLIKFNLIKLKTLNRSPNTILTMKESFMCMAAALTTWPSNGRRVCGFNMAKQWSSLVVRLPKHDSPLKLLGKLPTKQKNSWENPAKRVKWSSLQIGSHDRSYSIFVQPCLITSSRDLLLSFHWGKPQDSYFHLLFESRDLDIMKALTKTDFANSID